MWNIFTLTCFLVAYLKFKGQIQRRHLHGRTSGPFYADLLSLHIAVIRFHMCESQLENVRNAHDQVSLRDSKPGGLLWTWELALKMCVLCG
jgi:hypothetical protein